MCCHLFHFTVVVDVHDFVWEGVLCEMLYVDDLVLVFEAMDGFVNMFWKWLQEIWIIFE